jgi:hypothetical protein
MLPIVIVCVAAGAVAARAAVPDVRREAAMESLKRRVPNPRPVSHGGIRYEVLLTGKSRGFEQNGGIIRAIDEANSSELWTLVVYRIEIKPEGEEPDAQEVFITKLALEAGGKRLVVDNDRKERFRVDLSNRTVTVSRRR